MVPACHGREHDVRSCRCEGGRSHHAPLAVHMRGRGEALVTGGCARPGIWVSRRAAREWLRRIQIATSRIRSKLTAVADGGRSVSISPRAAGSCKRLRSASQVQPGTPTAWITILSLTGHSRGRLNGLPAELGSRRCWSGGAQPRRLTDLGALRPVSWTREGSGYSIVWNRSRLPTGSTGSTRRRGCAGCIRSSRLTSGRRTASTRHRSPTRSGARRNVRVCPLTLLSR